MMHELQQIPKPKVEKCHKPVERLPAAAEKRSDWGDLVVRADLQNDGISL